MLKCLEFIRVDQQFHKRLRRFRGPTFLELESDLLDNVLQSYDLVPKQGHLVELSRLI